MVPYQTEVLGALWFCYAADTLEEGVLTVLPPYQGYAVLGPTGSVFT